MTKMIALILLLLLSSCEGDEYRKLMEPALKAKLADKNPHPMFDGEEEPPIPDEKENNKTILGIDKNNNGIRDDIDIWINRTGKNYNERMALRQLARADQEFVKAAVEKRDNDAEILWNRGIAAGYCLEVIFPSNHNGLNRENRFKLRSLLAPKKEMVKRLVELRENVGIAGDSRWGRNEDRYRYCEFKIENQKEVIKNFIQSL